MALQVREQGLDKFYTNEDIAIECINTDTTKYMHMYAFI